MIVLVALIFWNVLLFAADWILAGLALASVCRLQESPGRIAGRPPSGGGSGRMTSPRDESGTG